MFETTYIEEQVIFDMIVIAKGQQLNKATNKMYLH